MLAGMTGQIWRIQKTITILGVNKLRIHGDLLINQGTWGM